MAEVFPISCVSCRSKKIRCNKQNPCNQCRKRNIPCHFPATFRNIKINEYDFNDADYYQGDHAVGRPGEEAQLAGLPSRSRNSPSGAQFAPTFHIFNDLKDRKDPHLHRHSIPQGPQVNFLASGLVSGPVSGSIGATIQQLGPNDTPSIADYEHVRKVNLALMQEVNKLQQQVAQLSRQNNVAKGPDAKSMEYRKSSLDSRSQTSSIQTSTPVGMTGETSERGEKYYGPQSSAFMIEKMNNMKSETREEPKQTIDSTPNSSNCSGSSTSRGNKSNTSKNKLVGFGDFMENSSAASDSKYSDLERSNDSSLFLNKNLVEQSLNKKQLPVLLLQLIRLDDPDLTSDSATTHDLYKLNLTLIHKLVVRFFEDDPYYETFINKPKVFAFLNEYEKIRDKEWENDDDLLLFYMILLLSVHRLCPSDFVSLNLLPASSIHNYDKFKTYLCRNVLFNSFEKLRHNLLNESVLTIQAYILCTEYHFISRRYEECWSTMFHCCSIAYSIGLHVMGQFRRVNPQSESLNDPDVPSKEPIESVGEDDEDDEDDEIDTTRFRVFFALKNVTGQICSILGRPNPISIQVNSVVLKSTTVQDSIKKLNANEAQVLLKIGLSECLRLSNSMLIENFMIDFTVKDLLNLRQKFEMAISLLEQYHHHAGRKEDNKDELRVSTENILKDLIILHINNAKLTEPFINKFQNTNEYEAIIKGLLKSISEFLKLSNELMSIFIARVMEKESHISNDTKMAAIKSKNINAMTGMGRLFRSHYPFLNSFIYQGIIVIFTFLHYKCNDFVENGDNADCTLNNFVLSYIETHLRSLLKHDRDMSLYWKHDSNLWSANIVYLIKKVLRHINSIRQKQNKDFVDSPEQEIGSTKKRRMDKVEYSPRSPQNRPKVKKTVNNNNSLPVLNQREDLSFTLDDQTSVEPPISKSSRDYNESIYDGSYIGVKTEDKQQSTEELDGLYGLRIQDPFWIANPDNLPYYLSSPSDDGPMSIGDFNDIISNEGDYPQAQVEHKGSYQQDGQQHQYPGNHIPQDKSSGGVPHMHHMYNAPQFVQWGVNNTGFLPPNGPVQIQLQRQSEPINLIQQPVLQGQNAPVYQQMPQQATNGNSYGGASGSVFNTTYVPPQGQARQVYDQQLDGMNYDFSNSSMYGSVPNSKAQENKRNS